MKLCLRSGLVRASVISAFAFSSLLPTGVFAAGEQPSTGTLVGAVTCGADEVTPAANAVVSVPALNMVTRTDSGGRFTLTNVAAGQSIRLDAATDQQQSSMSSRYDVVVAPGEMLDIGSLDLAVCPQPAPPTLVTTDQEMEQRPNPAE